ncbi:MAG: hypothetical protein RMM29_01495 [Planctomycetota bacterium]|nr:hypothetical protein [Planctomycetota bacterium]
MGGFFGKKQDKPSPSGRKAAEAANVRKSVRRVVPGAGKAPSSAASQRPARPAPEPAAPSAPAAADDVIDLPEAAAAPVAAPARARPAAPIAEPEFAGSLQAPAPSGPSRSGDEALLKFLTGEAPAGEQRVQLISADQAAAARSKAESEQIPLDVALVQMGFVTEEALVDALSQATFVPHLKVDKYEVRKKALDAISRADAERYGVFPVDKLGNLLTLAMVNPLDSEALRALETKTGLDIKKVVATRTEIATAIDKYYGGKVAASEQSRSFSQEVPEQPAVLEVPTLDVIEPVTPVAAPPPVAAAAPVPAAAPAAAPPVAAGEIQDLEDLLGGEEVAPTIVEPVSIAPEAVGETVEHVEVGIAPSAAARAEPELAFVDAPRPGTGALSRSAASELDLEKTDAIKPPPKPAGAGLDLDLDLGPPPSAPAPAAAPPAPAEPAVPAAPARPAARVVDLVPVSEEEFRNAIRHGRAKPFERWLAAQTRPRILNAVAVEKELDGLLAGLYATAQRVA